MTANQTGLLNVMAAVGNALASSRAAVTQAQSFIGSLPSPDVAPGSLEYVNTLGANLDSQLDQCNQLLSGITDMARVG